MRLAKLLANVVLSLWRYTAQWFSSEVAVAYEGRAKLGWFDHRTDLPDYIISGIGQVVAEWSALERELEETIRLLMDADIQFVRIVASKMSAKMRILTAKQLIEARIVGGKLTNSDLAEYASITGGLCSDTGLQNKRDKYAHGLWDGDDSGWRVLRVRQKREIREFREEFQLERSSREMLPEPEPTSEKEILKIAKEISDTRNAITAFCQRLEASLAPLQHKPPEYTRRTRQYPNA